VGVRPGPKQDRWVDARESERQDAANENAEGFVERNPLPKQSMSEAYWQGRKMGVAMRGSIDDIEWLNPYAHGSIDAMEWDRGFNHGRYANNYDY
jgi:hypothetical protein